MSAKRCVLGCVSCLVFAMGLAAWAPAVAAQGGYAPVLFNSGMEYDVDGNRPLNWSSWNEDAQGPDYKTYLTWPSAWGFWWDGGLYRDVDIDLNPGDRIRVSGYFCTPSADPLREGTMSGSLAVEFYADSELIASNTATPRIDASSRRDEWIEASATATVPPGASKVRVVVRCNANTGGQGRFLADHITVVNLSTGRTR